MAVTAAVPGIPRAPGVPGLGFVEPAAVEIVDRAPLTDDALDALRAHIASRIAAAAVEESPFPHLVVEGFFPPEVYADILRWSPFQSAPGTEWLPADSSLNVSARTPYHARKQVDLTRADALAAAPGGTFWNRIQRCFLADDWFARLILAKYPAYFRLRFGDLVHEPDFLALLRKQLFVQRHEPGFSIGPHTDLPTRVFTCIFSFADREGFEEYGTQLLAHRDRLVRCWGTDHHDPAGFVVRKLVPYRPNGFVLFFKTRYSFHAVPPVDERVPGQRYGMQFQLHEPARGLFRDLSVPQLMDFKRY